MRCAVWAEEGQEDLCWYEAEQDEDGNYIVRIFASDFGYVETTYNIHVYAIDSFGNSIFMGGTTGEIS